MINGRRAIKRGLVAIAVVAVSGSAALSSQARSEAFFKGQAQAFGEGSCFVNGFGAVWNKNCGTTPSTGRRMCVSTHADRSGWYGSAVDGLRQNGSFLGCETTTVTQDGAPVSSTYQVMPTVDIENFMTMPSSVLVPDWGSIYMCCDLGQGPSQSQKETHVNTFHVW